MTDSAQTHSTEDLFIVGDAGLPKVLLVDDVWFQDYFKRHFAFMQRLLAAGQEMEFALFEETLREALGGKGLSNKFRFDVDLLLRLWVRCKGVYQLGIASFAAFQRRFGVDFDRPDTALLISMGRDKNRQLSFAGPQLLADCLRGCRPRAEVVFITGYPDEFQAFLDEQWTGLKQHYRGDARKLRMAQARWWGLRSLSVVHKYKHTLDAHLNGFFDFFAQRFQQDIPELLVKALRAAQRLNPDCGPDGDPAHLQSLGILEASEERFGNFPLSHVFHGHEQDPGGAVESFKALFSLNLHAQYRLSPWVLAKLLKLAGFDLHITGHTPLKLPTRPGALFVFGLLRFLIELREMPLCLQLHPCGEGHELSLPMDRSGVFVDALATRNSGGVVMAFRDWISGNCDPLVHLEPQLSPLLRAWADQQCHRLDGHRPVWKPLLHYRFAERRIILRLG